MRRAGGGEPAVDVVEAAPGPDRRQRRGQREPLRARVVRRGARDRGQAGRMGQLGQGVVALGVGGQGLVGELDGDVVGPEPLDESPQLPGCGVAPSRAQGLLHATLAAARERQHPTRGVVDDLVEVVDRAPLLLAPQLRDADGAAERAVTLGIAGEQQQVAALGIGHAVLRGREPQAQLRAEDRAHAQLGGGLGEPDHAVHAVVVGERDGVEPQPGGLLDQLLGMAGAVEEAEVGVAVQLGVGGGRAGGGQLGRGVRLALARPGRTVAAVGLRPSGEARAVARAPRQRPLQVGPRYVRVAPAHSLRLVEHVFDDRAV